MAMSELEGKWSQFMESPAQIEDKSMPSPRPMWRRPLVRALAAAAVAVVAATAFLLGWRGDRVALAATDQTRVIVSASSVYVELPEIVANLSTGAAPRFVKVRAVLRVSPGRMGDVEMKQAEILDAFTGYLHALHPDELYGAAGFERLRVAFRRRAVVVLGEAADALDDVLLVEFIRQ